MIDSRKSIWPIRRTQKNPHIYKFYSNGIATDRYRAWVKETNKMGRGKRRRGRKTATKRELNEIQIHVSSA